MAETRTKPTGASVDAYLASRASPEQLADCKAIDGRIEATFGRFGNYDGQFLLGHDIAVGADGAVYVVGAWGNRVQKFARSEPRLNPALGQPRSHAAASRPDVQRLSRFPARGPTSGL